MERLLGEHPDTISAMNNLANTYESFGKYADAEKLQIQVLDMRSRFLGEEHPDTINVMENLAITFYYLQKYKDAARLEVQVLDIRKKIFGEEHPQTVKAVAILAVIRSQANTNTPGTESKKKGESYLL
jgi:tetratricopeptide (TPR) repeat protein